MPLIEIPLPYTDKKGHLLLNTGPASYARLTWDASTENNLAEKIKILRSNAKNAMDNIDKFVKEVKDQAMTKAEITANSSAADASSFVEGTKTAAERIRSGLTATEPKYLFRLVSESAERVAHAVSGAYEGLEKSHRCDVFKQKQEEFEKARAEFDANTQLVEQFGKNNNKMVLVIGGGVSGLMTAWILLDKGYRVSIVAKEWRERDPSKKERITSQIAGALWEYPPGGCGLSEIEVPVLAYSTLKQYRDWAMQSFLFYEHLVNNGYSKSFGARMVTLYQLFHHSHEAIANTEDTDPVVRRARDSAEDHFKKWKAIQDLDQKSEVFKTKLDAARYCLPPSEKEPKKADNTEFEKNSKEYKEWKKWRDAMATISPKSDDFKLKWGYRHQAPVVDTDVAMEFLMKLVRAKGAILETREIKEDLHLQERELKDDFKADIIVNASGLGARTLANDNQVFPVRGAVRRMVLPPKSKTEEAEEKKAEEKKAEKKKADSQAAGGRTAGAQMAEGQAEDKSEDDSDDDLVDDVNKNSKVPDPHKVEFLKNSAEFLRNNAVLLPAQYDVNNQPSKTIFIVPRSGSTLIVGSIIQRNNWNLGLTLRSPEVQDMWKRAQKFVPALSSLKKDERPLAQGLRPFSHSNVRVSADNRTTDCRVVHNYGHGGSGWTLAVGCAWTCVRIIEKILHEGKSGSVANAEVWGLDGSH